MTTALTPELDKVAAFCHFYRAVHARRSAVLPGVLARLEQEWAAEGKVADAAFWAAVWEEVDRLTGTCDWEPEACLWRDQMMELVAMAYPIESLSEDAQHLARSADSGEEKENG